MKSRKKEDLRKKIKEKEPRTETKTNQNIIDEYLHSPPPTDPHLIETTAQRTLKNSTFLYNQKIRLSLIPENSLEAQERFAEVFAPKEKGQKLINLRGTKQ